MTEPCPVFVNGAENSRTPLHGGGPAGAGSGISALPISGFPGIYRVFYPLPPRGFCKEVAIFNGIRVWRRRNCLILLGIGCRLLTTNRLGAFWFGFASPVASYSISSACRCTRPHTIIVRRTSVIIRKRRVFFLIEVGMAGPILFQIAALRVSWPSPLCSVCAASY